MGAPTWLTRQVEQYDKLPMYRSYRCLAAGLMGLFAIITALSIVTIQVDLNALLDVVILLVLMVFVYLGSSFAIVVSMIYWTAARAMGIVSVVAAPTISGIKVFQIALIIAAWGLNAFLLYRALRVAIYRKRQIHEGAGTRQEGHYCMKCGHVLPSEALFCPQCGCDQKHHIDTVKSKKHGFVITTEDGSQYVIDLKKRRHAERILIKGITAHDPRTGKEIDIETLSRNMPGAVRGHRLQYVFSILSVILLAGFLMVHLFDLSFKPKEYDARSIANKFNDNVVWIESDESVGSGVIISSDGLILTNNHVVSGGGPFKVRLNDGRYFPVTSIIPHDQYDLAVISIPATDLEAVDIKCQPRHDVGMKVISIGNPMGLEHTVTEGIISAIRTSGDKYAIQFDAAISPGSSGGLLVNSYGEAIGVPTILMRESQNLNFAIPIEYAKEFLSGEEECTKQIEVTGEKLDYGMAERRYRGNIRIIANTISDMIQEARARPKFRVNGVVIDDTQFPELLVLRGNSSRTGKGNRAGAACEQQDAIIAVFNASFKGLQRPYYQETHCCHDVYTGFKNEYGYVVPIYMLGDCMDEKMHETLNEALKANVSALIDIAKAKGISGLNEADFPESQGVVIRYYGAIRNREPARSLEYIIPDKRNRGAFTIANYESYSQRISDGPQVYEMFTDERGGIFALVIETTYGQPEKVNLVRFNTEYKDGSWYVARIVPVSVVER